MLNTQDLMNRYKISKSGIRLFINRNLSKINADGIEHAKQTSEGWLFDAEAVKRIDELRGFSQIAIVEQQESETIKELQQENENLRQLLLIAQSKLIKVQENLNENQKLLSVSEQKLLSSELKSKDVQADLKVVQAMLDMTKKQDKEKIDELRHQLEEAKQKIDKLKKRDLLDRIFNNF